MTESLLSNVDKYLSSGKYIGGGVNGKFERMSFGIFFSAILIIIPLLFKYGAISVGIFGVIEKILWQLTDLMKTCLWQRMQISRNA